MAVLQMQKISICALKKDRKAVLEKLQRMKVMEISQILEEDPDFTTMDTRQERMELEKSASLSDQALEILDRYAPEKKSMFSFISSLVQSAVRPVRKRAATRGARVRPRLVAPTSTEEGRTLRIKSSNTFA